MNSGTWLSKQMVVFILEHSETTHSRDLIKNRFISQLRYLEHLQNFGVGEKAAWDSKMGADKGVRNYLISDLQEV